MLQPEVRIGISGWRYRPWRGVFYPNGLPQRAELTYASSRFDSIEINGSFYSLQRPSSWRRWYAETPPGFVFAVKGGRFLTHHKKLRDCETPLANFFASGVLALEEKLGPILWQLPPQLPFDPPRLAAFFDLLPRTTAAAATLARGHDQRLRHGAHLETGANRPLRYALEVRHPSFVDPAFLALLRRADVALCVADTAGRWPFLDDVTTRFVYVRLHGDKQLYASGYGRSALDAWATRVAAWRADGRDVFVYFDNDVKVHAPYDAMNLAARVTHGVHVPFPVAARRRVEAARGVEVPRSTWARWGRPRSRRGEGVT
ncbi:MAG TPA: DUF72 domain-containing protein [Candidatus Binatia bacterium]|jgi:uncharacterized protein YecE (DUF72 family)|nr:DUF72 domain-containing protein [Candidatus Binatia bacterium]